MKYTIRSANENDLSGLCSIRNNLDLFKNYIKQVMNKEIDLVIAEQNSLIVGFGVLKLKGILHPKLSDLFVKEVYRGTGIGSEIIRYRENIARDLGYTEIFVSVDPIENTKMVKLIKKHGYETISEPYIKKATYYKDDGSSFDKTYTRIDLKKLLY
ncbi:GNAT family N-acetyltransferase [Ureibacillus manganicus]|uniref:Acetyltransferase n=1 Tax=Ureibacillus manganicus DSM 26584 TaxID=1384049 RepID=A0A0A3I428_9BACL|nr:GNAT family N-acetyltransferase [Ureibacillus manganicus]KGR77418.1 acetyltransferase [Ureibacillus manganicus DSM 26584]